MKDDDTAGGPTILWGEMKNKKVKSVDGEKSWKNRKNSSKSHNDRRRLVEKEKILDT